MCDGTLPLPPNFSVDSGGEGGLGFSPLPWVLSVSFYWISSVDCSHLSSLPSQVTLVVKNLPANAGDTRDTSLIPGSGRSSGEGNGNLLQCSCLENWVDGGIWWATVHEVTNSWTRLSMHSHVTHTVYICVCVCVCVCIYVYHMHIHTYTHIISKV